jgi:tellurite resistance protein TehA-like permease
MRRALVLSALSVTAASLMLRALHIESMDTAITAQLAFAAFLFLAAWFGHWIKSRKEG